MDKESSRISVREGYVYSILSCGQKYDIGLMIDDKVSYFLNVDKKVCDQAHLLLGKKVRTTILINSCFGDRIVRIDPLDKKIGGDPESRWLYIKDKWSKTFEWLSK